MSQPDSVRGAPAERPPEPSDEPAFDKCAECDHYRGEHGVDGCRCITVDVGGEYPCSCKAFLLGTATPERGTKDVKETARDLLALLLRHGTLVPDDLHRALRAAGVAERRDPQPSDGVRMARMHLDGAIERIESYDRHDAIELPEAAVCEIHEALLLAQEALRAIDRRGTGAEPTHQDQKKALREAAEKIAEGMTTWCEYHGIEGGGFEVGFISDKAKGGEVYAAITAVWDELEPLLRGALRAGGPAEEVPTKCPRCAVGERAVKVEGYDGLHHITDRFSDEGEQIIVACGDKR